MNIRYDQRKSAIGRDCSNLRWIIIALFLFFKFAINGHSQTLFSYDPAGNLTNLSASVSTAPSITAQSQSLLIESNTPVTLSVVANGLGITYQWFSNGVPIVGATGDSLVLPNLPLVNSTNFSVVISNYSGSITSTPVALLADSNGNGIPDWWEMEYFGNLNQTADGDYDGDGVDNLDEYLEGTNPNNANSYDPRLYLQGFHGNIVPSPDQPYYTMGQVVTLTAVPDAGQSFVSWGGSLSGTKPVIAVVMNSHKTITASFGLPLPIALDNTNLIWTTGGNVPWYGQTEISEDGFGAGQSGLIIGGQQSWLQTVTNLSQPMQLGFWWDVSSQAPDGLNFSVDGTNYASISGEAVGWQYYQTNLPTGSHTLLWTYSKDSNDNPTGIPFADSGWVGDVTLTPLVTQANAPILSIQLAATNTALLYWPTSSSSFRLQQNSVLGTTNWLNVTNPIIVVGGQNEVTNALSTSNQFFRLIYP